MKRIVFFNGFTGNGAIAMEGKSLRARRIGRHDLPRSPSAEFVSVERWFKTGNEMRRDDAIAEKTLQALRQ